MDGVLPVDAIVLFYALNSFSLLIPKQKADYRPGERFSRCVCLLFKAKSQLEKKRKSNFPPTTDRVKLSLAPISKLRSCEDEANFKLR